MSVNLQAEHYAVFGDPIQHSKSPRIHTLFAEQTQQPLVYTAQRVPASDFTVAVSDFFAHGGKGLNCTVPLKELAWNYAEHLSARATLAKAVNTLKIMPDGSIYGDNTDGVGLLNDLKHNHIQITASRILVLGAGGATRGIVAPLLAQNPTQLVIANRTASKALALVQEFRSTVIAASSLTELSGRQFDLIINATSASLSDDLPELPENLLATGGSCYDLAYATQATSFVRWGIAQQAVKSLDGLGMLVEQAAEAFYVWRGVHPDTSTVINLLNAERFNKS